MNNLSNLFETQKLLDNRIVDEHNLHGEDLLPKKILSLQVELGELANELPEVFKFWSKKKNNYEKALVEYCDCLHFILSIGNDVGTEYFYYEPMIKKEKDITTQFITVFNYAYLILQDDYCSELFTSFHNLGEMLGFTPEKN